MRVGGESEVLAFKQSLLPHGVSAAAIKETFLLERSLIPCVLWMPPYWEAEGWMQLLAQIFGLSAMHTSTPGLSLSTCKQGMIAPPRSFESKVRQPITSPAGLKLSTDPREIRVDV